MVGGEILVAAPGDVAELSGVFQLPHVRDFVTTMSASEIDQAIESEDDVLLLSRESGQPLSALAHLTGLRNPHRSIELRRFAVVDAGKGHGRRFLPAVMAEAFNAYHAQRLWLDVFPDNERARRLYRSLGFVEEGTLRNAYIWNGQPKSVVVMSVLREEL